MYKMVNSFINDTSINELLVHGFLCGIVVAPNEVDTRIASKYYRVRSSLLIKKTMMH